MTLLRTWLLALALALAGMQSAPAFAAQDVQITAVDWKSFDRVGNHATVWLLRSFADPAGGDLDVADPYYGGAGDFAEVLEQVEAACDGMVEQLIRSGVVVSA